MDNELKFGTITSDIIQSAHEVKKILGIGFLESVYEKALFVELKNKGYDVKSQSPIRVEYKGEEIGNFFADIIINEKIIIELKAVTKLANEHYAQLRNYLRYVKILCMTQSSGIIQNSIFKFIII